MLKKTNCYLNTDTHFATLNLTEGQTRSEKDNGIEDIAGLLRQLIKHSEDCGYYSDGSDFQLTAEKEKKRVFNEIISRLSV